MDRTGQESERDTNHNHLIASGAPGGTIDRGRGVVGGQVIIKGGGLTYILTYLTLSLLSTLYTPSVGGES